jgi:hypothetical protein
MRVDHGADIPTRRVERKMKERLTRGDAIAGDWFYVGINDEHIFELEPMVRHAAGGDREDVAIGRADAATDVSAGARDEARGDDALHRREDFAAFGFEAHSYASLEMRANDSLIARQRL